MLDISKLKALVKPAADLAVRKSPEILTALGISGFVTTVVLAIKATPKAHDIHAKHKDYRAKVREWAEGDELRSEIGKSYSDELKAIAPLYAPALASGVLSIAAILGAHKVQSDRAAVMATAYSLAERSLKSLEEAVEERYGEKDHAEVMQAVSDKLAAEDSPFEPGYSYTLDGDGKCMCFDRVTGRYFKSTPEIIRSAESEVNKQLIDESIVTLGVFYYLMGVDKEGLVDDALGWDISKSKLDVYFSSSLDADNNPLLVLNYNVGIVDRRVLDHGRR